MATTDSTKGAQVWLGVDQARLIDRVLTGRLETLGVWLERAAMGAELVGSAEELAQQRVTTRETRAAVRRAFEGVDFESGGE